MSNGSSGSVVGVTEEALMRERRDGAVVGAPPKTASSMTRRELNRLAIKFNIPTSWGPRLALQNERIHSNFCGYFAVSGSFFSVGGMRLPYAPIIDEVCSTYGMLPSQIPPNSWRFINGLSLLCHQFGHPPSVGVLRHFLRMSHSPSSGAGIPFLQYRDARYRPARTPSKVSSWRVKYFFVKPPGSSSECRPWRYPLAEQWNDASTLSLGREEWELIGRIKELGRYNFDRLIQGYPWGASADSFLVSPPPQISGLKEETAPSG